MTSAFSASVKIRRAIVAHARRDRPRECCGFLLGRARRIEYVMPMRNMATGTTRYRIDDAAHVAVRRVLREMTPPLEIVGVYHSHPAGRAKASPTDVAEAHYPEWIHVIVGLGGRRPDLRGFRITDGRARELRVNWR